MKFQNLACTVQKLCYASKSMQHKNAQLQQAITHDFFFFFFFFLEFIQKLIRSSTHQYQSIHWVSRLYLEWFWRYFAEKPLSIFFQRAKTQKRGIIWMRKKNMCELFFHEKSIYEFQNPSMHCSEVMLCIKMQAM